MSAGDIQAIKDWLVDGARSAPEPSQVLEQLCERLVAEGIPLWRVAVFVRTLHPEVMGRRFVWRPGAPVEATGAGFDILDAPEFTTSPIVRVVKSGTPLRRRLCDSGTPDDFPVLAEFRADGVSDYLVEPLIFTDGEVHVVTMTTREPNGFSDAQVTALQSLMPALARVAEVRALRRTAANLLNTYVGNVAGARILGGQIRRGHTEHIHAAIWHSDMRGFTALADRLPPEELIGVLNRFFDCQAPEIESRGGEVLKFIGDGLLAIFPITEHADASRVCRAAFDAACAARANVTALASSNELPAGTEVRFGIALHVGEVLYGNIGGGKRLDFTCIGPAVNLASRIESLTRELRRVVLASEEFARVLGNDLTPVGAYSVRGLASKVNVFGLREETR